LRRVLQRHRVGGGQKHAFQEDSAFANVDESQLERTISSWKRRARFWQPSVPRGFKQLPKDGALSRQRSRVRVSSSPPFKQKWLDPCAGTKGPKRYRLLDPIPVCADRFSIQNSSLRLISCRDASASEGPLHTKTQRGRPLAGTWQAILRLNYLTGAACRGRTSRSTLSAISSSATSRS